MYVKLLQNFPSTCRNFKSFFKLYSTKASLELSYKIHDEKSTQKKTVIFILHGLMGSKNNWNSLGKAISSRLGLKVICADARNHGSSPHTDDFSYSDMANDLRGLILKLNASPAIILGHSMGGRTAMLTSLLWPDLVKALVVVDISPLSTGTSINTLLDYVKAMKLVEIPTGTSISAARSIADKQLATTVPDASLRQFLIMNLVNRECGSYAWRVNLEAIEKSFLNNISRFPNFSSSTVFREPTLFIGGTQSDYLPKSDEPEIKKLFPSAKFLYVENAGHWVHVDQPAIFMDSLCSFIKNSNLLES